MAGVKYPPIVKVGEWAGLSPTLFLVFLDDNAQKMLEAISESRKKTDYFSVILTEIFSRALCTEFANCK